MQFDTTPAPRKKLGIYLSAILGIAGNAPAYSIAVTTLTLVTASGWMSPWVMAFCGLLMFGIAGSYRRLNANRVSGGAAFTWVTELVNPTAGFLAGWSLLVASILFLISASLPAAQILLGFISASLAETKPIVTALAAVIIVCMGFIASTGVLNVGRVQTVLTSIELVVLVAILGGCALLVFTEPVSAAIESGPSELKWSVAAFAKGIVVAVFFYWGWDVVFNASEETEQSAVTSGRAAYVAMFGLMALFTLYAGFIAGHVDERLAQDSNGNALLALSKLALPAGVADIAVLAFLLSTIGAISASFVQFSQTLFAQAREGYFSSALSRNVDSTGAPRSAIVFDAVVALVLLVASTVSSTVDEAIQATIGASAILVAFYYGMTAIACVIFEYRTRSGFNVRYSAGPVLAACVLIGAAGFSAFSFSPMTLSMVAATYTVGLAFAFLGRGRSNVSTDA